MCDSTPTVTHRATNSNQTASNREGVSKCQAKLLSSRENETIEVNHQEGD